MRLAVRHPALILVLLGGLAFAAVPGFDLVRDDRHFLHPGSPQAQAPLASLLALARAGRLAEARAELADAERAIAGADPRLASWRPIAEQARVAVGETRP